MSGPTFRATALTLLLAASASAADVSRRLDDYVLFASERIRTRGLHVVSGDLGVDAGVFDTRAPLDAPASTIGADVVRLPSASTCAALFATGIDTETPSCPLSGVFIGPVIGDLGNACGLPSGVPACASANGVAVGSGETRALAPGTYGSLDVRSGGQVVLSAGRYVFCRVRAGRRARIEADAASELVITGDVAIGPGGSLAPTARDTAAAPAVIADGNRVTLSRGVTAIARLCAPQALLIAGDETTLGGRFAARAIRTGHATATGLPRGPATTTSTTAPVPTTSSTSSTSTTSLPIPTTSSTSSTSTTSSSLSPTTSTSSTSTTAPPTTSSTIGTIPTTTISSTSSTSTTSTSSTSTSTAPPTSTVPTTSTTSSSTVVTTSTSSTSTTRPGAVCGNNQIEPGETCDDGNTRDGDSCPANCRIEICTAVPSTARVFTIRFTHPAGADVSGITVLVDYPEGKVSIPGSGGDATVKSAVTNLPAGALGTSNDLDYAVREVVASFSPIPEGRLFTLTLQDCQGATPPAASEFSCRVEDAADSFGLPVDGVTCSVEAG